MPTQSADELHVSSTWVSHLYQPKDRRTDLLFGRSELVLRRETDRWLIAREKVMIANEALPSVVDFYHL